MSERFDVIAFHDIVGPEGDPNTPWKRIGGGSFGVVYAASYLGTKVAVKEVLPNDTYDVAKYFERECVLMKEARHPNIVQYIGLSRSPGADGRIYIISEFVGPNLRSFIADTRKPFPWRLRISFATDIARALAYLHARNCLHRDLKPENLLITDNDRIKMCDFGFARIAARNEEEMRRMSYCGTDGYMSPEILLGLDFSLPSDIFSLGVIFAEIASRHLVDATTFKRSIPSFTVDPEEIRDMASEGCPAGLVQLAIDCTQEDPAHRPDMREVLMRLRVCEEEVIAREEAEQAADTSRQFYSVGSIRGASSLAAVLGTKKASRPGGPPRLPSFQGEIKVGRAVPATAHEDLAESDDADDDNAEAEVEEALAALEKVGLAIDPDAADLGVGVDPARPSQLVSTVRSPAVKKSSHLFSSASKHQKEAIAAAAQTSPSHKNTFKVSGHGNPWWSDEDERQSLVSIPSGWTRPADLVAAHRGEASNASARQPLLAGSTSQASYSTSVVRSSQLSTSAQHHGQGAPLGSSLSVLTARNGRIGPDASIDEDQDDAPVGSTMTVRTARGSSSDAGVTSPAPAEDKHSTLKSRKAPSSNGQEQEVAADSTPVAAQGPTEPSAEGDETPLLYHRFSLVKNSTRRPAHVSVAQQAAAAVRGVSGGPASGSLLPPAVMLSNALARCWVCGKRIGFQPFCECDDCPMRTHVGCSQLALPNCQEFVFPPASAHGSGVGGGAGGNGGGHGEGSGVGGAGNRQYHYHPRAPSVQPALYASNSGPRWHHGPALRSSSSSASSSSTSDSSSAGDTSGGRGGDGRKSSSPATSSSTPRSDSRSRNSSSSRSNSVDVAKDGQGAGAGAGGRGGRYGPSRAAETLAAYVAAAGLVRDPSSGALTNSNTNSNATKGASGAVSPPLPSQAQAQAQAQANGTGPTRPLSPTPPQPQQRSSSMDGKFGKLIKGAKRFSSGGGGGNGGGGGSGSGAASPTIATTPTAPA